MNHTVNAETVIAIHKAQRNAALDELAMVLARNADLESKNDALTKEMDELKKKVTE